MEELDISESLQIRKIISLTSKRFLYHYSDLKSTDLNIAINNTLPKEQNLIRLKDFTKKIKTCIEMLLHKNEDWTQLRKSLSGEEKKEELAVYNKFVSENNFLEMIGEAQDICSLQDGSCKNFTVSVIHTLLYLSIVPLRTFTSERHSGDKFVSN